jgi:hypothetical protein
MPRFFEPFIPNPEDLDSRLGGYSIWSASLIAPHIKKDNYSGHVHLTASMQSRKYSEDIFKMKFGRT